MSELSPESRAFLETHRRDGEPTAADAERVRAALALTLGSTALASATVPWLARLGVIKGTVAVTVVVVALVGAVAMQSARDHGPNERGAPPTRGQVQPEPVAPAPAPETSPAPVEPLTPAPPAATVPKVRAPPVTQRDPRSPAPSAEPVEAAPEPPPPLIEPVPTPVAASLPPPPPTPAPLSTADEVRLVGEAEEALRRGDAEAALAVLEQWSASFGQSGQLAQEAQAARIVALCKSGQTVRGGEAASQYFAAFPASPYRNRIERDCGSNL